MKLEKGYFSFLILFLVIMSMSVLKPISYFYCGFVCDFELVDYIVYIDFIIMSFLYFNDLIDAPKQDYY